MERQSKKEYIEKAKIALNYWEKFKSYHSNMTRQYRMRKIMRIFRD